tara:strand:+ start:8797 stop:9570 length:774 start_codon:yes stop_codon:yes gene_type:complete
MKIVGFTQLRNELSKGNLENWFKCMEFCDYIYIYDQASDDGSLEFYKNYSNAVVIESSVNDFDKEISCKKQLLEKLLNEHPDTDWIFWMDGDTLLDGRLLRNEAQEIKMMLNAASSQGIDILTLGHYNLWRSDIFYRVDTDYDWLHNNGVKAFWRNNGDLSFPDNSGLHQPQHPLGLKTEARVDRNLIHRGFATEQQILTRYNLYKSKGQKGYLLDRLIDEKNLSVVEIDKKQLPDWFQINDAENPIFKKTLINKNE